MTAAITGTGTTFLIASQTAWICDAKARAEDGLRSLSSRRSAPPMKDFVPAPVRIRARRCGVVEAVWRVERREEKREEVRMFSLRGLEMVMVAVREVGERVVVERRMAGEVGEGGVVVV